MKDISQTLQKLELAALGGDVNGWVCRKVFMERSGVDTDDKLYLFRKEHPELVRVNDKKQFIYHLPGYFETFKSVAS